MGGGGGVWGRSGLLGGCVGVRWGCQRDNVRTTAGEQVGLHADKLTEPGSATEPIKTALRANRWDGSTPTGIKLESETSGSFCKSKNHKYSIYFVSEIRRFVHFRKSFSAHFHKVYRGSE